MRSITRRGRLFGFVFALGCAVTLLGCGSEGPPLSPSSFTPVTAPGSNLPVRPLDSHELPDPTPPAPAPVPPLAPATVTISIAGSVGNFAFVPNPSQASMGDLIVWTNKDRSPHRIVLDDGTVVGDVAPGASTAPMPLTSATATYHCTIHPSMVGSINGEAAPPPPPDYPPPDYPPPPGDYYSYGGYRH